MTIADAVVCRQPSTDDQDALLRAELTDAERVEFLAVASLYLGLSAVCSVLQIPSEPGTHTLSA